MTSAEMIADLGPPVILWTRIRGSDTDKWEVLPERVAKLTIVLDQQNDATIERAMVYRRIPKNAPMDIAKEWLRARMERSRLVSDELLEFIVAA